LTPPKWHVYIRNKLFLQSFWKASYINSHADGFYSAPARKTPPPPRLSPTSTFTPYYRLCYTTLKDAFHCASTSHRIRSMRLSCSHGHRKVNLPPSHFLFHKRDLPVDHSRSPIIRPSRYEDLFILLFLNFLFSFYDNANTFTFYERRRFELCLTFFPSRRNSQSYNLSFMKNQTILFLSV